MKAIFWISVSVILYTYLVYPLLLIGLASLRQVWQDMCFAFGRAERRRRRPADVPSVSMVFSAYNEQDVIVQKMRNCARIDYPTDRLEILVGCDGCSDGTASLARAAHLANARVIEFRDRMGKANILNQLVPQAKGEIIVFSDANTMLDPGAVRSLVRHFSDPRHGCVCGELRLSASDGSPRAEGVYWRFEVFLKFLESRMNLLVGANGAIYAIRRELFSTLPKHAIIDDFLIALRIRAAGHRIAYDPEAIGYEDVAPTLGHEFRRRVRIGAGNFHALKLTTDLLLPTAGTMAFSYWSHKVFRWMAPFAIISSWVTSVLLVAEPLYASFAGFGMLFVGLGAIGYRMELHHTHCAIFSIPYYFLSMNLALLLGFLRFLRDRQPTTWDSTLREKQMSEVA